MLRYLAISVFCLTMMRSVAQTNSKSINYNFQLQNLYSTHGTQFPGLAMAAGRQVSRNLSLGLGAEYSYANAHPDNEFYLTKLKFVPVFIDLNWFPITGGKFQPYFHTSHGASLNSYHRAEGENSKYIRELGYYAYVAPGLKLNSNPRHAFSVEVGLKGFKMSTSNLDINPHGITGRLGYSF